eukprot:TRINITY_DN68555_c0_g1_i1.p1 TRINITY_DN68555_c0_g1~~TRINITY_DN68555_c0_g1_i1.p1  ORF type:complete len:304 (-),score=73.66 TRINITY_DN68555_c0_g1_i1:145-1056(-)
MSGEQLTQQDCFSHKLDLSISDKIKFLLCSVILVPVRLCLALLVAFLIWFSSRLGLLFKDPATWDDTPLQGWRAFFQNCMWTSSGYIIFYALGFRVKIVGQQAPRSTAPILIVAPHSSFLDVFTIALCSASPVARVENRSTPVLWAPQAVGHTIFVDRRSVSSRAGATNSIISRASSPLPWPQIFIFTEGTTTNGKALIRFQTGGFKPGQPVQPVTIRYGRHDLTTWTRDQDHRFIHSILLIMANPVNSVTLEFLPVYQPSQDEQENSVLFAQNVQAVMAANLGIPTTDIQRAEFVVESKKHS